MKELLDLFRACLNSPQDVALALKRLPQKRLSLIDAVLVCLLGLLVILALALLRKEVQFITLLVLPLAFLLWALVGFIAFIWCVNSKGEASLKETLLATPLSLFFPTLLTILLLSLNQIFIGPRIAESPVPFEMKALDLFSGMLGPVYGWLFFYKVLRKLHQIKPRYAMGASLVALFLGLILAYFAGTLLR